MKRRRPAVFQSKVLVKSGDFFQDFLDMRSSTRDRLVCEQVMLRVLRLSGDLTVYLHECLLAKLCVHLKSETEALVQAAC